MKPLKKAFWFVFYGIFNALHATLGRLWRKALRPYSGTMVDYTRRLRVMFWWHRFDAIGRECVIGRNVRVWGPLKIFLGRGCSLRDHAVLCGTGVLTMDDGASLGHDCVIVTRERISVGKNVMIAAFCYLIDVDHEFESREVPIPSQGLCTSPITIGDDVWIGAHCVILRGVTIGKGAVVGANSVVLHDVPEYSVVAGVPARHIKMRGAGASSEMAASV